MLSERNPQLEARPVLRQVPPKSLRRDADDDVTGAVDDDRSTDDAGIGVEAVLPEAMRNDDFPAARGCLRKPAAARQRDVEHLEIIR